MSDLVEKVRYEADIADIKSKMAELKSDQNDLATEGEKSGGRISGAYGKVAGGIGAAAKVVGVGILSIAGAGAVFGPMIINQGASLDALKAKSATVFEASLGDVQRWADGNAAALGMTKTQLVGTAAGVADLFKPMGFGADAAASMSEQVLNLSGALSAWTGGKQSTAEVSDVLTKAYLGETDGLKSLGISISANDVQARLARDGNDKLTGSALEQAKALAIQQLITEKSTDAQKAWADGSMDGVKASNESKASIAQLKESLVAGLYPAFQAILPVITELAGWLSDHIPAAIDIAKEAWAKIEDGFQWLIDNKPILVGAIAALAAVIVPMFIAWAMGAGEAAIATIAATWPVLAIAAAIGVLAAGVYYAYQNFGWFHDVVDAVGRFFRDTFWPILQDVFGWLRDNVPPIIGSIVDFLQQLWDKSEGVRSFLAGAFKLAVDVVITEIELWWGAVSTVVGWLQTLWDKSEVVRGFLAGAFALTLDGARMAFDAVWGAVSTVVGWLQTLWDKSESVRSLIAGGFSLALDALKAAFGGVKDIVQGLYDVLYKTWELAQKVLGLDGPAMGVGTIVKNGGPITTGNAPVTRIHSGGIVQGFGTLRADEIPAILQKGEMVLTADQQAATAPAGTGDVNVTVMIPAGTVMIDPAGVSDAVAYAIDQALGRVQRRTQ